jgi:hypothetical protein
MFLACADDLTVRKSASPGEHSRAPSRARRPVQNRIRFISVDKKVVSTCEMATGKWTHFDPPRDRAEFGPMV